MGLLRLVRFEFACAPLGAAHGWTVRKFQVAGEDMRPVFNINARTIIPHGDRKRQSPKIVPFSPLLFSFGPIRIGFGVPWQLHRIQISVEMPQVDNGCAEA